jgi:Ni2+-binding GTPase involved in maturation of urease and hydrogenase
MTLLLGPPSSGKTTLMLALAGKLDKKLKVRMTLFALYFSDFYCYLKKKWQFACLKIHVKGGCYIASEKNAFVLLNLCRTGEQVRTVETKEHNQCMHEVPITSNP